MPFVNSFLSQVILYSIFKIKQSVVGDLFSLLFIQPKMVRPGQCDQIGQFIGLWATF